MNAAAAMQKAVERRRGDERERSDLIAELGKLHAIIAPILHETRFVEHEVWDSSFLWGTIEITAFSGRSTAADRSRVARILPCGELVRWRQWRPDGTEELPEEVTLEVACERLVDLLVRCAEYPNDLLDRLTTASVTTGTTETEATP